MKHLNFMSSEWLIDFNSKPYDIRLGLFKGFTTWQRMWYLTTVIDTTNSEQIKFRSDCRALLPKPEIMTELIPIDYSLINTGDHDDP